MEASSRGSRDLTVGIDLDGVLADQVWGVLPRIKSDLGVDLREEEISEFRLRLGTSDLATEIERAQLDPSYILEMPVRPGALDLVNELRRKYRVLLVTARPAMVLSLTRQWIQAHQLIFDGVISAVEEQKSLHATDVLIDDYTNNIEDYLRNTQGLGILLDRPWNRCDRTKLAAWSQTGRSKLAAALEDIPSLVEAFATTLEVDIATPN